jgi:hypothetical protein
MARAPAPVHIIIYEGLSYGPHIITCLDSAGAPVDLTGYTPYAQVRDPDTGTLKLDLAPVVSDAAAGQITMNPSDEDTTDAPHGKWKWDLILKDSSDNLFGPIVAGNASILAKISQA